MSGEVQTVGAGNSWVEYGLKTLKQEQGFITMKGNEQSIYQTGLLK